LLRSRIVRDPNVNLLEVNLADYAQNRFRNFQAKLMPPIPISPLSRSGAAN
jgi:hypothetical protein